MPVTRGNRGLQDVKPERTSHAGAANPAVEHRCSRDILGHAPVEARRPRPCATARRLQEPRWPRGRFAQPPAARRQCWSGRSRACSFRENRVAPSASACSIGPLEAACAPANEMRAYLALDMRVVAELLLRHCERLVEARQARRPTKSTAQKGRAGRAFSAREDSNLHGPFSPQGPNRPYRGLQRRLIRAVCGVQETARTSWKGWTLPRPPDGAAVISFG